MMFLIYPNLSFFLSHYIKEINLKVTLRFKFWYHYIIKIFVLHSLHGHFRSNGKSVDRGFLYRGIIILFLVL